MKIIILGLLLFLYFSLHSTLANEKVKAFLMDRFISKKYYRIFFNLFSVVSLIPIFFVYKKIEATHPFVNVLLQNIGFGITVMGVLLLLVALKQYNLSEFAGTQQLKKDTPTPPELRTSSFNSIVRHPLYLAGLIIIWGFFLFRPTDLFLMISLIATAYLYFGIKQEEEILIKQFGEEHLSITKRRSDVTPIFLIFKKKGQPFDCPFRHITF